MFQCFTFIVHHNSSPGLLAGFFPPLATNIYRMAGYFRAKKFQRTTPTPISKILFSKLVNFNWSRDA